MPRVVACGRSVVLAGALTVMDDSRCFGHDSGTGFNIGAAHVENLAARADARCASAPDRAVGAYGACSLMADRSFFRPSV